MKGYSIFKILVLMFISFSCSNGIENRFANNVIELQVIRNTKACDICARYDVMEIKDNFHKELVGRSVYIHLDSLNIEDKNRFENLSLQRDENFKFTPVNVIARISLKLRSEEPFAPRKTYQLYILKLIEE